MVLSSLAGGGGPCFKRCGLPYGACDRRWAGTSWGGGGPAKEKTPILYEYVGSSWDGSEASRP